MTTFSFFVLHIYLLYDVQQITLEENEHQVYTCPGMEKGMQVKDLVHTSATSVACPCKAPESMRS